VAWLRDVDRWFVDEVLPSAALYRRVAARLTRDAGAAEDLVQDAYVRVIAYPRWRELASPSAFTLQVLRNLARDAARRETVVRIDAAADLHEREVVCEAPDAHAVLAARQELDRVRAALDALPPQCRAVVRLRRLEGRTPRQIAEQLGLSVSTVEKHLVKGLRLVMERLARSDATPGADKRSLDRAPERSRPGSGRVAGPAGQRLG